MIIFVAVNFSSSWKTGVTGRIFPNREKEFARSRKSVCLDITFFIITPRPATIEQEQCMYVHM